MSVTEVVKSVRNYRYGRAAMVEQTDQQKIAQKAAMLKADRDEDIQRPKNDDFAHEELISTHFKNQALAGAFDAEGHRPVLERSRKVR